MEPELEIFHLQQTDYPGNLQEAPKPPKDLYGLGTLPAAHQKFVTIVGSRNYTSYGRQVAERLIADLAGYPVSIISGLALGMDTVAHESALRNKLNTIAVPGSGLLPGVLYPASNHDLARRILTAGGLLLSPFTPETKAARWTFPVRNQIMAAMADVVVVIEAGAKSGTLLTAQAALDLGRDVLAVPGSIFSETSVGSHSLIKSGAYPVTRGRDILEHLGFKPQEQKTFDSSILSSEEKIIYDLLAEPRNRSDLIRASGMDTARATTIVTALELKGLISEQLGLVSRK